MDGTPLVVSQITLGAVASWLIQRLKNAKWFPILEQNGTRIANVLASLVAALAAITGLSYQYDATAHTVLIQNFSLAAVGIAIWHWFTQFVMNEGWYQLVFNKVPPTAQQEKKMAESAVIGGTK